MQGPLRDLLMELLKHIYTSVCANRKLESHEIQQIKAQFSGRFSLSVRSNNLNEYHSANITPLKLNKNDLSFKEKTIYNFKKQQSKVVVENEFDRNVNHTVRVANIPDEENINFIKSIPNKVLDHSHVSIIVYIINN